MPKKSTGYTPSNSKGNPDTKLSVPMKNPSLKPIDMPKNGVASMPKASTPKTTMSVPKVPTVVANSSAVNLQSSSARPGAISRPAKLTPRTPRI